jgi:hypothetical protein
MTVFVYKSITGLAVNVGGVNITTEPGIQFDDPVEALDRHCGTLLARYTDGVLDSTDGEDSSSSAAATVTLNWGHHNTVVKTTSGSAQSVVLTTDVVGGWIGASTVAIFVAGAGAVTLDTTGLTMIGTAPTIAQNSLFGFLRVASNTWKYL